MVKVEFEYNPYLMEYTIKFNEKEPRINSLIEKYDKFPLQTWVDSVPDILYDEMNGYDFDLEFVGTMMDYKELERAFVRKGVSADEVRFVLKRNLESRSDKLKEIKDLCSWLDNNRNHRFDYDEFKKNNIDIFECNLPLIIIGDVQLGEFRFDNAETSVEIVESSRRIGDTELINIPVVIEADRISKQELQTEIRNVLSDNEITEDQLFFYIGNPKEYKNYFRIFTDLGIKKPQSLRGLSDACLKDYFEYYPISDYIRKFVFVLRKEESRLEEKLNGEKKESEKINGEAIKKINAIEAHITRIKSAISALSRIKETSVSLYYDAIEKKLTENISNWKNKKTIITSYSDALVYSAQFEEEAKRTYNQFVQDLDAITLETKKNILEQCTIKYLSASGQDAIKTTNLQKLDDGDEFLDDIKDMLVRIKDEKYEKPREGVLDAIFKSAASNEAEKILVITYPCQEWRTFVIQTMKPQINKIVKERTDETNDFCKAVSKQYIAKLEELLKEKTEKKDMMSSQLSEDIQILQRDTDWLALFDDKLEQIERD